MRNKKKKKEDSESKLTNLKGQVDIDLLFSNSTRSKKNDYVAERGKISHFGNKILSHHNSPLE